MELYYFAAFAKHTSRIGCGWQALAVGAPGHDLQGAGGAGGGKKDTFEHATLTALFTE